MTERDKFFWAIGKAGGDSVLAAKYLLRLDVPEYKIESGLNTYYDIITDELFKAAEQ